MHKLLILFLILVALFFMFMKKSDAAKMIDVAGTTGPGYIPAFQGHPQIGVKS
jgi:hypothetical protein